jgi:hypothetical protein
VADAVTVIKLYTVNCDSRQLGLPDAWSPNCPGWIGNEDALAGANAMARQAGWKHVDQMLDNRGRFTDWDLCPHCFARLLDLALIITHPTTGRLTLPPPMD